LLREDLEALSIEIDRAWAGFKDKLKSFVEEKKFP
jgi:hypothetical protein